MNLSSFIDHTLLKPTATPSDIITLCEEAKTYGFFAVCVNSCYVSLAKKTLLDSPVKIASTVGFPLGASSTSAKCAETEQCINDGAHEIDMVINVGFLKYKLYELLETEIRSIKEIVGKNVLKVIIETCYLTEEEKRKACQIAEKAGADFVKTSTGFGSNGATLEDVELMLNEVGKVMRIKASGGIKDYATAKKYIDLGVSRIGTSSGIAIVTLNPTL